MTISFSIPGKPARWERPIEGQRADGSFFRYNSRAAETAKRTIAAAAAAAFVGRRPHVGPVIVRVVAIFPIPPSWPAKTRAAAAEARVMHVADPDLDQIVKLVKDALKGIAYVDDNQVCGYPNSAKRYGSPARTDVTVTALAQRDDEKTPGQRRLEARIAADGWDAVLAPVRLPSKTESARGGDTGGRARSGAVGRRGRIGRQRGRRAP